MVKSDRQVKRKDNTVVDELLDPEDNSGSDWFTKLAKVERAKAFRREGQKARKRKPIPTNVIGRWSGPSKSDD